MYMLNFNNNELILTYVGKYDATAYNFKGKDLITQKELQLSDFRGSYILLDFWGSWCGPCIAGIPELIEFATEYKDRIEIISIAFDHDEDLPKLKTIIKEKEMNWSHIREPKLFSNPAGLNKKFDVKVFPTFILIDKSGNIIYRSTNDVGIQSIKQFLSKIDDV